MGSQDRPPESTPPGKPEWALMRTESQSLHKRSAAGSKKEPKWGV